MCAALLTTLRVRVFRPRGIYVFLGSWKDSRLSRQAIVTRNARPRLLACQEMPNNEIERLCVVSLGRRMERLKCARSTDELGSFGHWSPNDTDSSPSCKPMARWHFPCRLLVTRSTSMGTHRGLPDTFDPREQRSSSRGIIRVWSPGGLLHAERRVGTESGTFTLEASERL